jgi:hypothetical protein
MISANACSGDESPELSTVSDAPEVLAAPRDGLFVSVLAGFSFEFAGRAASGLLPGKPPFTCVAIAPVL